MLTRHALAARLHSMTKRRPLVALATLLAVLGTALWPLVASLRDAAAGEAMPLCHQAGLQVDPASAPLPGEDGQLPVRKTHCPLCVMVFVAAFGPSPAAPAFVALRLGNTPVTLATPLQRRFEVALPQGRAPPAVLA